jgi:transcriptional regulator NrdR family protein
MSAAGATYRRVHTTCPDCKKARGRVTNTLPERDGFVVRYHKCPACGARFKTVQEVSDNDEA